MIRENSEDTSTKLKTHLSDFEVEDTLDLFFELTEGTVSSSRSDASCATA